MIIDLTWFETGCVFFGWALGIISAMVLPRENTHSCPNKLEPMGIVSVPKGSTEDFLLSQGGK